MVATKRSQEFDAAATSRQAKCPKSESTTLVEELARAVEAAAVRQGINAGGRAVLLAMARGGLAAPADGRHELQSTAVQKVHEVLAAERAALELSVGEAEAKIAAAEKEREAMKADKDALEATQAAKESAVRTVKLSLANVTKAVLAANKELKSAEHAQQRGDSSRNETKSQKELLEAKFQKHFPVLSEGFGDALSTHLDALTSIGTKYDVDPSLVTALPNSVAKAPEERRKFDLLTLQQFEEAIKEKLAEFSAALQATAPEADAREGVVAGAREVVAAAKAALLQAAADYREANAEDQEGLTAVHEIDKRDAKVKRAAAAAIQGRDDCQVHLDRFVADTFASFETLRDRLPAEPMAAATGEEGAADAPSTVGEVPPTAEAPPLAETTGSAEE